MAVFHGEKWTVGARDRFFLHSLEILIEYYIGRIDCSLDNNKMWNDLKSKI